MRERIVVAAVQLSSQAEVGENLRRAGVQVAEAARRGAQVVVLPENFAFMGGGDEERLRVAEDLSSPEPGPIRTWLGETATAHGVWILAGGLPERSSDPARVHNTFAVVAPDGGITATYRKIHMFDVEVGDGQRYRESASCMPGDKAVVADVAGARVGLSICYDVRFPELYRALVTKGAEVLVVPAAFTLLTGKDHWHVLLRARAIESQCYVIAAAQWGSHPRGRRTFGKSCVIDPWGEIIAQSSEGEGLATATLDPAYLEHVRSSLPSLTHRKLNVPDA
ncbi:carbon-nitrogen hydrolase family protein [Polyangium aurulentum]|uniref:carbon-nitrogen hydrolase family protein n=1 Tax=Polyangium aurulentum TaxID=2567896 RepID=UPI0010ADF22D|nr:carbon-nitrogen hydrolase family protein [Polyangium aurulentum]UQA55889.1 carbon-nitrogen hydrolase family protein [Polyangium aurulentum]